MKLSVSGQMVCKGWVVHKINETIKQLNSEIQFNLLLWDFFKIKISQGGSGRHLVPAGEGCTESGAALGMGFGLSWESLSVGGSLLQGTDLAVPSSL